MPDPARVNPFLRPAPGFYPGGQRRRLLDQLRHLSQWSRRALLVLGPPGTGKTMLFHQLGREMNDGVLLTQLDGRALNAELDVLIVLAEALGVDVPDSFSAELLKPLVEAALAEQEDAAQPLVVLVDDADQLDAAAMRLLLQLCGAHRFRLLLFGQLGLPEQVRGATRDLDVAPYETSLLAFSPVDSRAYLEWRCEQAGIRGGLPFSEEQVSELYRRSNGVPGDLNRLAGQLLERIHDGDQSAARLGFPATHLYLVAGLVAVLALSFLLLDRVPLTEEVVTENLAIGDTSQATPTGAAPRVSSGSIDRSESSQAELLPDSTAAAPARPQRPASETAAVAPVDDGKGESAATNQPFVAAEPIALPEPAAPKPAARGAAAAQATAAESGAAEKTAARPARSEPTASEQTKSEPTASEPTASEPIVSSPITSAPAASERTAEAQPPVAARQPAVVPQAAPRRTPLNQPMTLAAVTDSVISEIPGLKDGAWLLAQEEGAYTLQLVTLSNRDGLLRYLKRQADPEQFAVYAREVGGKLLYVVTFGRYPSRAAAEAASRRLPTAVGRIKPWIRPFAEVQNSVTAGR